MPEHIHNFTDETKPASVSKTRNFLRLLAGGDPSGVQLAHGYSLPDVDSQRQSIYRYGCSNPKLRPQVPEGC